MQAFNPDFPLGAAPNGKSGFNREQDMLIVPGKFDHLCLRHAGEKTIDIVRDDLHVGPSCKEKQYDNWS